MGSWNCTSLSAHLDEPTRPPDQVLRLQEVAVLQRDIPSIRGRLDLAGWNAQFGQPVGAQPQWVPTKDG
eukprot:6505753-Alexandrium_andersonii.AAC.1